MDLTETLDVEVPPDVLLAVVEDLATYPRWLTIVPVAERELPAPPVDADEGPAWSVELRGRLGPMARSKRLRMVRTARTAATSDGPAAVRFERLERDGRQHAPWVLEATVAPRGAGSRLTMHLHYGGGFGTGVLERLLRAEVDRSRPRLQALVEHPERGPAGDGR